MSSGLEGVIVAETVLSHTDSERGMVWMRGHDLPGLVANHGFEGTVALLWDGFAGEALTRAALTEAFGAARVAAFAGLGGWLDRARDRPLLEGMRSGLAFLPDSVTPFELIGAMTVMVPALLRSNNGMALIEPDPALSTPADLLRMWHGAAADPAMVAALDTYFTVMAESGLNGSSFTARIVASTRASLAAAVLGAWCAFTGPLHGGAPGPTLDMLDAAEAAPDLDAWLEAKLRSGERLMGFGHRVFRGNDPRAEAMRSALTQMGPISGRLAFASLVEARVAAVVERVKPGRRLPPNVEIMAALLLDAVGFPREAFTPVFAVGRCAGWIAHALEQRKTGRLIRPSSKYVGVAV
ncbi:MAG: citrate synthase [Acetobacteraceae bacterium]